VKFFDQLVPKSLKKQLDKYYKHVSIETCNRNPLIRITLHETSICTTVSQATITFTRFGYVDTRPLPLAFPDRIDAINTPIALNLKQTALYLDNFESHLSDCNILHSPPHFKAIWESDRVLCRKQREALQIAMDAIHEEHLVVWFL